jgi:hypothetical protein
MTLSVTEILSRVTSHAKKLGVFNQVVTHEPKSAPRNGMTVSFWVSRIEPVAAVSGLATTSARIEVEARLYAPMLSEPQDSIDLRLLEATDKLMAAYSGDFTLDGQVMDVDLLGRYGTGLSAETGYIEIDKVIYRVMVITLPLIVADLWTQAP